MARTRPVPFAAVFNGDEATLRAYIAAVAPDLAAKDKNLPHFVAQNPRGQHLLYIAARFGHVKLCELIIEACGREIIDVKNSDGSTALHGACFGQHADVVKLLIGHGASRTVKNAIGETPLDNAEKPADGAKPSPEIIALLTAPPPPTDDEAVLPAKKKRGDAAPTPQTATPPLAVDGNQSELSTKATAALVSDPDAVLAMIPAMSDQTKLELLIGIAHSHKAKALPKKKFPGIIAAVLSSGFDISATNADYNNHPLHFNWEAPDLITMLLKHGLKPPKDPHNNVSYVHLQILFDHVENMCAYLDFMKHSPDDRAGYGYLPLTFAARVNSHKCAKELLKRGASVNMAHGSQTALLQAVRQYDKWSPKKVEMVRILMAAGADPTWVSPDEGKAIMELIRPKNEEVLKILKKEA